MARTHRPTARWTAVTLLHTLLIAAIGYGTHQALPAAMGWIWRWVALIAVTLTASLAAWTDADIETEWNLAEIDAYLATRPQQPAPAPAA
jgi:hypothetical protein